MKDLSTEVSDELTIKLADDEVARKYLSQSFGIKHFHRLRSVDLVEYFPDTPVKLMKEVFEALQLYDLVDLLEKPRKSHPARSLRIALPLHEIEKLRKTADRPTTYHSSAAVLIIDACYGGCSTEVIDSFFKDLNSKSKVTTIKCRHLKKIETEACKEIEKANLTASAVIDRWIQNPGW